MRRQNGAHKKVKIGGEGTRSFVRREFTTWPLPADHPAFVGGGLDFSSSFFIKNISIILLCVVAFTLKSTAQKKWKKTECEIILQSKITQSTFFPYSSSRFISPHPLDCFFRSNFNYEVVDDRMTL